MSTYQSGRILLVNSLLIITFNGLLYWQPVKNLLTQRQAGILIGLVFYAIQFAVTYRLSGSQKTWLIQPFQTKYVVSALAAIVVAQGITICLIVGLTTYHQTDSVSSQITSFLLVFVLNSLPGALLEEWLFRYLPFRLGQQATKRYQPVLYCLGALVLFTLLHIPAYLLQYNLGLVELGKVFMMGILFMVVYLLTRNLVFTAFFHGLTNKPLYVVESPYYWLYFYISVLVVSMCWAVLNRKRHHNSATI
ncbi:CAAX prenyl protease-like protein [Spirosoma oryzae]|uniref:CAAX prenyl protease-like protein n=1 Tax=Spirosoma oryzae TaxID=1469603 RepID=A0A2T0TBE2_9BACT|nr:CPBP family intramembrane glutamic endopeptidase [Spirosoma oryzae]PRY42987.1 CAAX prenyl protease-like protein [Spirosoma oryzae]